MTDIRFPSGEARAVRVMLLAFGAACLLMLPARAVRAQVPPINGCVTDPASCLPDPPPLPDVDECVANPSSCLPPAPSVDECVVNPSSCLPPTPSIDKCVQDPSSCVKPPPEVDRCVEDLESCASDPPRVDRCVDDVSRCLRGDEPAEEEDGGGAIPPGDRSEPPRFSGDATGRTETTISSADADGSPLSSEDATSAGSEAPAIDSSFSTAEQVGQGLADAARRFAFPLVVAALVGAFLLVQGRLDGKDPKLAVSPIDARDELVIFE